MEEVRFSDLDWIKGRDPLWVGGEIDALRRYRPMTPSFPLNKVDDELRDFRSPDDAIAVRVFDSFFSDGYGNLDDKLCDPFKVKVSPFHWTQELGDIPRPDLIRPRSQ